MVLFCGTTRGEAPAATITGLFPPLTSATAGREVEVAVVNVLGKDDAETVTAWPPKTVADGLASTFTGAMAAVITVLLETEI